MRTETENLVILERLAEYGIDASSWSDPWGACFHPSMIETAGNTNADPYSEDIAYSPFSWSAEKHAARIRYILKTPQLMNSPIEIDCLCNAGTILAMLVIVDGWHRLHAHWYAKRETIPATFGGRLDLWDYLRGESSEIIVE